VCGQSESPLQRCVLVGGVQFALQTFPRVLLATPYSCFFLLVPGMCIYVDQLSGALFRHLESLKRLQTHTRSKGHVHKLSKTPSHGLIGVVGGPHHHFGNTGRARDRVKPDHARPQGLIMRDHKASRTRSLLMGLMVGPGSVWTGKRARSALKVML
jgi:hypothetical protein